MSCSRKLKLLFTGSIVLNVLVLGAFAGHFIQHMNRGSGFDPERASKKFGFSPDAQLVIEEMLTLKREDIHNVLRGVGESKDALGRVISQAEFDEAAYDEAAQGVKNAGSIMTAHKIQSFKELAQKLSQEERVKLARMMDKILLPDRHNKRLQDKHKRDDGHVNPE